MKAIIDIPNYEFNKGIEDRFQDYFNRVKADIDNQGLCGNYERETTEMFLASFKHAQYIPNNSTNGEQFLISHPDVEATILQKEGHLFQVVQLRKKRDTLPFAEVYIDWWNAKYEGVE